MGEYWQRNKAECVERICQSDSDSGMGTEEYLPMSSPHSPYSFPRSDAHSSGKVESRIALSPFLCPIQLTRLTRAEFDALSRQFMAQAFASQNELGRLCDEVVYQNDLAMRVEAAGLGPVATEVPLAVRFGGFTKDYSVDLVVQNSFLVELKTVTSLVAEHEAQLLNYLFIAGAPHGKLVNLRTASVQYRTVNAVVTSSERRSFKLMMERWRPLTSRCAEFMEVLQALLSTWGVFLDSHLYEEALIYFFGGRSNVLRRAILTRVGKELGTQLVAHLTDAIGFRVTSFAPDALANYEVQLHRFLMLTPLTALHWLNLHHKTVDIITVTR